MGRPAGRRGRAGLSRTRHRRPDPAKRQSSLGPAIDPQLTRFDKQLINGTVSALGSWLLTIVPTRIGFCQPFPCKACPGICFWCLKIKNSTCKFSKDLSNQKTPDTPQAGRVGAAHGRAAGQGRAGKDGTRLGRFDMETALPLALRRIENTVLNFCSEAQAT